MTTAIKAIETEYAGCRFRSRLEARWAVFFDALGIRWHYEEQGYELPSGRYLPDFRIEEVGAYGGDLLVEVKGKLDDAGAHRLMRIASEIDPCPYPVIAQKLLLLGDIPRPGVRGGPVPVHIRFDTLHDLYLLQTGVAFHLDEDRVITTPVQDPDSTAIADLDVPMVRRYTAQLLQLEFVTERVISHIVRHPSIDAAYKAARSARFEYGESGAGSL